MTKRDYLIIFLLLLPFFVTLPWALVTRHRLKQQLTKTEQVQDSLDYLKWYYRSRLESVESIRQQNAELALNQRLRTAPEPEVIADTSALSPPVDVKLPLVKQEKQEKQEKPPLVVAPPQTVPEPVTLATATPELSIVTPTTVLEADPIVASGPAPDSPPVPVPTRAVRLVEDQVYLEPVDERMWERLSSRNTETPRSEWMEVRLIQEVPEGEPAKSSNARRLEVDLALNQVPEAFRGQQTLYLVVTDQSGVPVSGSNPIAARLPMKDVEVEMTALAKKDVRLRSDQEIHLEQLIPSRLPSGDYRVQVFSDLALLAMMDLRLL